MTNQFKPFSTGVGANVIDQATYEALSELSTGFELGLAQSDQFNKVFRQGTFWGAVLGDYIFGLTADDVLDDGDVADKVTLLTDAIQEQIDASVVAPVFTDEFISSQQAIVLGTKVSVAHGLGGVPKQNTAVLVCLTDEHDFVAGDEIPAPPFYRDSIGDNRNIQLGANATNVWFIVGTDAVVISDDVGNEQTLTPGNWALVFRAWR